MSLLRIIIAFIIFFTTLLTVSVLLYSAIRNSIISIGRNPLSQAAVYKGLSQVFVLVLVILIVAFGSIYLVVSR